MMISKRTRNSEKEDKTDNSDIVRRFISDFGIEPEKTGIFIGDSGFTWIKRFFCRIDKTLDIDKKDEIFFTGESIAILDGKKIIPTLRFLEILRDSGAGTIKLNDKASWLFICGRDILPQGIVGDNDETAKKSLVVNLRNEIIGVSQKSGKELNNYWNIGDYLKRENHREN